MPEPITINSGSLSVEILLELEAKLARCGKRKTYWADAKSSVGAVGRMLADFLRERNQHCTRSGCDRIAKKQIASLCKKDPRDVASYLKGQVGNDSDWADGAFDVLKYILLGGNPKAAPAENEVANRILALFFHYKASTSKHPANKQWYFAEHLKTSGRPATTLEGIQEVRAIAYYSKFGTPQAKGMLVRCSGYRRFPQVNEHGGLTASGVATADAMAAGVRTRLIYPAGVVTPASKSAQDFVSELKNSRKCAKVENPERILHPIDVGKCCAKSDGASGWGGEWLSPSFIYVYHHCQPLFEVANTSWRGWTTLLVSRNPDKGHSPDAFETDEDEVKSFEMWLRTFAELPEG